ncbi:sigma-54-dependent Fis family transcriptional regulator, partial [Bacteroides fragilis]
NVRELEHTIERAVILSGNPMLMPNDLMLRTSPQGQVSEKEKYNLERQERETISEVLRLCAGNITLASEMLGITRTSLYRRIEKHGL